MIRRAWFWVLWNMSHNTQINTNTCIIKLKWLVCFSSYHLLQLSQFWFSLCLHHMIHMYTHMYGWSYMGNMLGSTPSTAIYLRYRALEYESQHCTPEIKNNDMVASANLFYLTRLRLLTLSLRFSAGDTII